MRRLWACLLLSVLGFSVGCSQETIDKSKDAAEATGKAIESAAKDTVDNTKKAVDKVDEAINGDDAADANADGDVNKPAGGDENATE